ncbi:MAG: LuxR family transcriptional regulator [Nevskiaceae bacterium]|nr:MAG: LuxR family transcriptional regulator [Nevskiaceae bacterium]
MADLDRMIQSLYAAAVDDEWQQFRPHALALLSQWLGASSAAWHTHSASALPGEFTEFPAATGMARESMLALKFPPGSRELLLDPLPPALAGGGSAPQTGLAVHYAHRGGTDLISTVLLRFPRSANPLNREECSRAIGHMIEAGSLSLKHFIQRDEWLNNLGRANRGAAALIDEHGAVYVASQRFRDAVTGECGDPHFSVMPYAVPRDALEGNGSFVHGSLHFRVSGQGSLYVLYVRKRLPLDGLSPREQEIARALGSGKTFKTVARQYGIAISTVANHASRIYKKLGIFRREELMELVRTPAQSHPH